METVKEVMERLKKTDFFYTEEELKAKLKKEESEKEMGTKR